MDAAHNVSPSFLRLKHIIGDQKASPPIPPIIPISKTAWWNGVRDGIYPKPIKLSDNVTVWRSDDIQKLVDHIVKTHLPSVPCLIKKDKNHV